MPAILLGKSSLSQRETRGGERRDDDLVEAAQIERVVYCGQRVGIADNPLDGRTGSCAECWQGAIEHRASLAGSLILGIDNLVQPVGGIGHEQREHTIPSLGALANGIEQRLSGGCLVGHHEYAGGSRGLHDRNSLLAVWLCGWSSYTRITMVWR